MISVLLPVHNGESTIGRAVRSTLAALGADSELLVLDDASTDRTPQVLSDFADSRLRVITATEGVGVARGLNRLLKASTGQWIARMDADDVVLPGRFARQSRVLGRGGLDVTFTNVCYWYPHRRYAVPPSPVPIGPEEFGLYLMLRNPVSHPAMMARREALVEVGGYRKVPSEDYDLWLRLGAAGAQMNRTILPGLLYRIHPHQVTASQQWRTASWRDEQTLAAYGDLSQKVLGARFARMTTLASDARVTNDDFEATMVDWAQRIRSSSAGLGAVQRRAIARILKDRISNARNIRATIATSKSGGD